MKRKIALLLAAVMTLSAAPMNLFAATSENKMSLPAVNVPVNSVILENSLTSTAGELTGNSGKVEYYTSGLDLVIEAKDTIKVGAMIDLELDGGVWFFRNTDADEIKYDIRDLVSGTTSIETGSISYKPVYTSNNPANPVVVPGPNDPQVVYVSDSVKTVGVSDATITRDEYKDVNGDIEGAWLAGTYTNNTSIKIDDIQPATLKAAVLAAAEKLDNNADGDTKVTLTVETINVNKIVDVYDVEEEDPQNQGSTIVVSQHYEVTDVSPKVITQISLTSSTDEGTKVKYEVADNVKESTAIGDYTSAIKFKTSGNSFTSEFPSTYDKNEGALLNNGRTYYRYGVGNTAADKAKTAYKLQVGTESGTATLTVLEEVSPTGKIVIPMVVRANKEDTDVSLTVRAASNNAPITTSRRLGVATVSGGSTSTYADDIVSGKETLKLDPIIIKENAIGSIKKGGVVSLTAPSGYSWNFKGMTMETEGGLSFAGDNNISELNQYFSVKYATNTAGTKTYDHIIEIGFTELVPSTKLAGKIVMKGLVLQADDDDVTLSSGSAINVSIKNVTTSTSLKSVTEESFQVAKIANYTLDLTVVDKEIPELVSGRLEGYSTKSGSNFYSGDIEDDYHKAAKVKVKEQLADSWWASKSTSFALPEGVRILKAEFENVKKFKDTDITALADYDEYVNAHKKLNGVVTINDNVITLSSLQQSSTSDKAEFEMQLWVNLEVDFEGDVDLTMTNYTVREGDDDDQSVTIATAITPVVVETKVSDVKIGLQYVPVADFDITETKAGNLLKGETVYVSVTDEISTDMYIAPGYTHEISEGNLKISNIRTNSTLTTVGTRSDAQLKFEIDRESTTASTISFSNVQVKIGREVPYSNTSIDNDRGINLVVWGPAIAKNYEGLYDTSASLESKTSTTASYINEYDLFSTPGIRAKYINVISKDTNSDSKFTNVVEVTIGNPVVLINGEEYTMPVAAYVSTASNSTMVPLRFVSYALGLDESAVIWDIPTSTATINAGSRIIQFTTGSNYYVVNGVQVPMVSPDGLAVATEISEERAFIPFRALGDAFDIPVSWNPTTSTATYNDPSLAN